MRTIFILFFISIHSCFIYGQINDSKTIDSLSLESYDILEDQFYLEEYKKPKKARIYAEAYLKKAKLNSDVIQIARGYKYLAFLYMDIEDIPMILKYCDSIINISITSNHKTYPAYGYFQKGVWLFEQGNYKEALDNYLIAKKYANKHNNSKQLNNINLGIAALKDRYGDYKESLKIYKDYLEYIKKEKEYLIRYPENYLLGLYNVANGYLRIKKTDSANIYINEGIDFSLKLKDSISYFEFLTSSGIANFQKKKYERSIDSLDKAITRREKYGLAMCYLIIPPFRGQILR